MSFVTLVRHGQANTGAKDEESYDRLSDMGWQQSQWLGEYFRSAGDRFARAYCGGLRRHRETAEGIGAVGPVALEVDERLNELMFFPLAQALEAEHGVPLPSQPEDFASFLPTLLAHWEEDRLEGAPERFADFEARIIDAITEITAGQGRALVVTSGGVVAMAMRHVMQLDIRATARLCLAIENSSVHRIQPLADGIGVTQFNALPHLDTIDRQHARSHI